MPDDEREFLRPTRPVEAREQAAECLGFVRGRIFDLGEGETWELPNPALLDDEQQARYNAYLYDSERCDRAPDTTDTNGNTVRGEFLDPPRINGELLEPSDIRLAKALMGEEIYRKFIAADGRSSQIRVHWLEMNKRVADRVRDDSKSGAGTVVGEPVPD